MSVSMMRPLLSLTHAPSKISSFLLYVQPLRMCGRAPHCNLCAVCCLLRQVLTNQSVFSEEEEQQLERLAQRSITADLGSGYPALEKDFFTTVGVRGNNALIYGRQNKTPLMHHVASRGDSPLTALMASKLFTVPLALGTDVLQYDGEDKQKGVVVATTGTDVSVDRNFPHGDVVEVARSSLVAPGMILDTNKNTPLHCAAGSGHLRVCQALWTELQKFTTIDDVDISGMTALHRASMYNRKGVVSWLLKVKADPNIQDARGRTPLHWACAELAEGCIFVFLDDSRVVTDCRSRDGKTARDLLKSSSAWTLLQKFDDALTLESARRNLEQNPRVVSPSGSPLNCNIVDGLQRWQQCLDRIRCGTFDCMNDTVLDRSDSPMQLLLRAVACGASIERGTASCATADATDMLRKFERLTPAQQAHPLYSLALSRVSEKQVRLLLLRRMHATVREFRTSVDDGGWLFPREIEWLDRARATPNVTKAQTVEQQMKERSDALQARMQKMNLKHDAMDKLMDLVGLQDAKRIALSLAASVVTNHELKAKGHGLAAQNAETMNFVFVGNPGTGKTTVARLFAQLLQEAGYRPGKQFVQISGAQAIRMGAKSFAKVIDRLVRGKPAAPPATRKPFRVGLGVNVRMPVGKKHAATEAKKNAEGAAKPKAKRQEYEATIVELTRHTFGDLAKNLIGIGTSFVPEEASDCVDALVDSIAQVSDMPQVKAGQRLYKVKYKDGTEEDNVVEGRISPVHVTSEKGGILFIDEAYELNPFKNPVGREILEQIMQSAEEHRAVLTIILAGYEDQIERELLGFNPGLRSRFPTRVHFHDFTEAELLSLWKLMCDKRGWSPTSQATVAARRFLCRGRARRGFGNAREVRKLLDVAIDRAKESLREGNRQTESTDNNGDLAGRADPDRSSESPDANLATTSAADDHSKGNFGNKRSAANANQEHSTEVTEKGDAAVQSADEGHSTARGDGDENVSPELSAGRAHHGHTSESPDDNHAIASAAGDQSIESIETNHATVNADRSDSTEIAANIDAAVQGADGDDSIAGDDGDESMRPQLLAHHVVGVRPDPDHLPELKSALEELEQTVVGLGAIKQDIRDFVTRIATDWDQMGIGWPYTPPNLHRLLVGPPGTGKSTIARIYASVLKAQMLLSNGGVCARTASDFIGSVLGETEKRTSSIVEVARGKVLLVDNAHHFCGSGVESQNRFGLIALQTLADKLENTADIAVLLVGPERPIRDMLDETCPQLGRHFGIQSVWKFPTMSDAELGKILIQGAARHRVRLPLAVGRYAVGYIARRRQLPNFANAKTALAVLDSAIQTMRVRAGTTASQHVLEESDFPAVAAFSKLDELLRSGRIKPLTKVLRRMRATSIQRLKEGRPKPCLNNFLFIGAPGTGKTTAAREMGEILHLSGVLASSHVEITSAQALSAQHVGHTSQKVLKLLDRARGGVLFVDEVRRSGPSLEPTST